MPDNEKEIAEILLSLGFQPHMMGYRYALTAIMEIQKDPKVLHKGITKVLYPAVAEKHDTKASRVERAIRHSVDICFENCTPDWEKITKNWGGVSPPTNGWLLATVAEVVRLKMVG